MRQKPFIKKSWPIMRETKEIQINTEEVPERSYERADGRRASKGSYKESSRRTSKRKKSHIWRNLFILLLVLAGVFLFLKSDYFIVRNIEVEGNSYFTQSEVISIAEARTGNNIIFDLEKDVLEDNIEKNPFFKSTKIKRKLPSTIIIQVEERPQVAAIIYGDTYIVIDDEGVILRRTEVDPKVTLLTGLTVSRLDIGEAVEAEEKETLAMTLRMLRTMQDGDMYFKKIDVSRVVIKAYIYDNLLVKGTPSEVNSAIESGELQKVVTSMFAEGISRGTIKMGGNGNFIFTPDIEDSE